MTDSIDRDLAGKAAMMRTDQKFTVSHLKDEDFKRNGPRSHAEYRDLGIAEATNGMVQAHVIRRLASVPVSEIKSKRHYHAVEFQMVYCLKGWMKTDFEGKEHVMRAGSCWLQPPGIRHKVVDRSEDCEVLEIIMPANFETVDVE